MEFYLKDFTFYTTHTLQNKYNGACQVCYKLFILNSKFFCNKIRFISIIKFRMPGIVMLPHSWGPRNTEEHGGTCILLSSTTCKDQDQHGLQEPNYMAWRPLLSLTKAWPVSAVCWLVGSTMSIFLWGRKKDGFGSSVDSLVSFWPCEK